MPVFSNMSRIRNASIFSSPNGKATEINAVDKKCAWKQSRKD
jgi:hypothetical protein